MEHEPSQESHLIDNYSEVIDDILEQRGIEEDEDLILFHDEAEKILANKNHSIDSNPSESIAQFNLYHALEDFRERIFPSEIISENQADQESSNWDKERAKETLKSHFKEYISFLLEPMPGAESDEEKKFIAKIQSEKSEKIDAIDSPETVEKALNNFPEIQSFIDVRETEIDSLTLQDIQALQKYLHTLQRLELQGKDELESSLKRKQFIKKHCHQRAEQIIQETLSEQPKYENPQEYAHSFIKALGEKIPEAKRFLEWNTPTLEQFTQEDYKQLLTE